MGRTVVATWSCGTGTCETVAATQRECAQFLRRRNAPEEPQQSSECSGVLHLTLQSAIVDGVLNDWPLEPSLQGRLKPLNTRSPEKRILGTECPRVSSRNFDPWRRDPVSDDTISSSAPWAL